MKWPIEQSRRWCAILAIVSITAECTEKQADGLSTQTSALATSNGITQNALWTNALWTNALWTNALWTNALWTNALWTNALWTNALWTNGVVSNALWTNALWTNSLTGDARQPGDALRNNGYTRQLLQYMFTCAMPASTYDTVLDPNDGGLACSSSGTCDFGYECSSDHKCVIPLEGGIGLGINADGTTWGASGHCDESCQRWVSACLLARTNAYGTPVMISMRAPDSAPQAIKDRLTLVGNEGTDCPVGSEEDPTCGYTKREGAYYGNIFQRRPGTVDASGTFVETTTPQPNGTTAEVTTSKPVFFACAGPESNVPEITKRFCSSQGNQEAIKVPGVCETLTTQTGVVEGGTCLGEDASGVMHDCYTTTSATARPACLYDYDPNCFKQVITVYLKKPIVKCGNHVCEDDGTPTSPETNASCPSDCHPGWAKTFDKSFDVRSHVDFGSQTSSYGGPRGVGSTLDPTDGSIVLAGNVLDPINFGSVFDVPGTFGLGLVKLWPHNGALHWQYRFPQMNQFAQQNSVAVGPDGSIVVLGTSYRAQLDETGYHGVVQNIWLAKFIQLSDPDGIEPDYPALQWGPIVIGQSPTVPDDDPTTPYITNTAMALDHQGNALITGKATGTMWFWDGGWEPITGPRFAIRVGSDGAVHWGAGLGSGTWTGTNPMAVDGAGNLFVVENDVVMGVGGQSQIRKYRGDKGTLLWQDALNPGDGTAYCAIAVDANGDVYGTTATYDTVTGFPNAGGYVAKFSGIDGSLLWLEPQAIDHGGSCSPDRTFLGFDPAGTVVQGTLFGGSVDLGLGTFDSYATSDLLLAGFSPSNTLAAGDKRLRWAKHIEMVLSGAVEGLGVDVHGNIVASGSFAGSMLFDDRLLVNKVQESALNRNTFVVSMPPPSITDKTNPAIGFETMPQHIYEEATSAAGAAVFYNPPTATDTGNAGVKVSCSPNTGSTFPITTTTVTCTAKDPLGNSASGSFLVTVVDTLAPRLTGIPGDITTPATGPNGATVTYPQPPPAIDQVDGAVPVTCAPASGSSFHAGVTTKVTCSATDSHGNMATGSFNVTVIDNTPPVLTLPGDITTTATCASGAVVTYTATATDAVDGPITPVCNPKSGSKFPLGVKTVTCTATDAAGNSTTGTFHVTVVYGWSGFLQPINPDGSSVFKLGQTIPVKFKLTGASAPIKDAVAKLTVAKVSSNVVGTDIEAISTAAATTGNLFRYDGGQYIFNLATKPLSVGTWRLSVDLGDGVSRTVLISLR